jgi:NDP-sugar pyrophosphorylase family protein
MYPVAILTGGLGTRLHGITGGTTPKALVPVLGRPFLDWKLEELARAGVGQVTLLVGHSSDRIKAHVGDGARFGLAVTYVDDGPELRGTGGALLHALPVLPDAFWVTYGDTLLEVDLERAEEQFERSGTDALMTVLHNCDRWEPSNVAVENARVVEYGKDPRPPRAEHIDYGMLAFRRSPWLAWTDHGSFDLSEVIAQLISASSVAAFEVTERFHDIGTVAALRDTERFLERRGQAPRPQS